jgi:hypothetical protein
MLAVFICGAFTLVAFLYLLAGIVYKHPRLAIAFYTACFIGEVIVTYKCYLTVVGK